ncbi:MAG: sigma-70 family RNA polymerase sigma factor [Firmicutes bacterium]|nr:sigma-70 family RNA polymerase sigma factor [Bacillota bacterium]
MREQEILQLVLRARRGDQRAREELIEACRPFMARVAARICGRYLTWENDDELSIALIAFNEAIDAYDVRCRRGVPFLTFAHRVIHRRLTDHFRRERRHRRPNLLPLDLTVEEVLLADRNRALTAFRREQEAQAVAELVERLREALEVYGIGLRDLAAATPRHRDTRAVLVRVARTISASPGLREHLERYGTLPLRALMRQTGVGRRVLERGRRYIIALVVILTHPDLAPLRRLIAEPERGGARRPG